MEAHLVKAMVFPVVMYGCESCPCSPWGHLESQRVRHDSTAELNWSSSLNVVWEQAHGRGQVDPGWRIRQQACLLEPRSGSAGRAYPWHDPHMVCALSGEEGQKIEERVRARLGGKTEGASRDLPGSPVVKTSPSNAGGEGLNRSWRTRISHALWWKKPKHKTEAI